MTWKRNERTVQLDRTSNMTDYAITFLDKYGVIRLGELSVIYLSFTYIVGVNL